MKESDLNRIINNGFKKIGFSHKISDPMGGMGVQNPFDGFSAVNSDIIFWEGKLIKSYKAFNFKAIEEHQIKNLLFLKTNTSCISVIILGVFESRKYFDVYFFDIELIQWLKHEQLKKSFLKKELLKFRENLLHLSIYRDEGKYEIGIDQYKSVIINYNIFRQLFNY
jgi:hypothetical protein